MAFDKSLSGKVAKANLRDVRVYSIPSYNGVKIATFNPGETMGRLSGTSFNMPDTGNWIDINLLTPVNGFAHGYTRESYNGSKQVTLSDSPSPTAEKNAQQLLNSIVDTDKKTYAKLIGIYRKVKELEAKGIEIPLSLRVKIVLTYQSLYNRQMKLKSMKDLKCTTGSPQDKQTAENLAKYVDTQRQGGGIMGIGDGGLTILIIIILAVIITAGSMVAIYYATKPDYEDSKRDFKVPDELQKVLDKLSKEDQQTILNESEKQIDDAYNAGKQNQSLKDFFTGLPGKILLVGGAFLLAKEFIFTGNRNKKQQ